MSKEFERADIQGPVKQAVNDKLKEMGVEPTDDHTRRTIRALLHTAGKMMLEAGGSVSTFRAQAEECITKERTSQEYEGKGTTTDVTVALGGAETRNEKRFLGGYVTIGKRAVKSSAPVFGFVQEIGKARIVTPGCALDIALREKMGQECIGGGSLITVVSVLDEHNVTIEYTTGYKG